MLHEACHKKTDPFFFWYDNDKDIKVGFLVMCVACLLRFFVIVKSKEGPPTNPSFSMKMTKIFKNTFLQHTSSIVMTQPVAPQTTLVIVLEVYRITRHLHVAGQVYGDNHMASLSVSLNCGLNIGIVAS